MSMRTSGVTIMLVMWLASGAGHARAETVGDEGATRRAPWGDGPPPWIKDGKVDEEARKAFFAGRRVAAESPVEEKAQGGQGGHLHHAGHAVGTPAETATPAPPVRAAGTRGESPLWLTDAPAQRAGRPGSGSHGSHGSGQGGGKPEQSASGMAGMNMGGVATKRVWLRQGANPLNARSATGEEAALLLDPVGQASELPVEPHGGPYNVKFPTPELGYYNVYFLRRAVDGDTLGVTAAKAEVANGGMGHGARVDASRHAPRLDPRVPVEIVRERKDKEALFTRINYGDEIAFQVLRGGQPVQNARVTFTSGQGWSNSVQSDEDGRAVFTVIRDYYTKDWSLFDKRHRETFLVTAAFSTPEAGEYRGGKYASTRYGASLSGAYYPGGADYESYSDGLMVGMVGLLFTGSGVWWYRRRRVRPYREVMFDE